LPGAELVARGLDDLAAGRRTVESLLVEIGAPRLRRAGVEVPELRSRDGGVPGGSPEDDLYMLLAADDQDSAHSRYNALVRALVSFERAAESASH
jgi:hypothetical protein